jgi:hypothetical protein
MFCLFSVTFEFNKGKLPLLKTCNFVLKAPQAKEDGKPSCSSVEEVL